MPWEHCFIFLVSVRSIGEVRGNGTGQALGGRIRRLDGHGRRDVWASELLREAIDSLQVECVEDLVGELDLVQLHFAIHSREYSGASRDRQIRILERQI